MDLHQLISYDEWANQLILDAIEKLPENELRTEMEYLFSHLLGAQLVWYNRMVITDENAEIWPEFSLSQMQNLIGKNSDKLKSLVQRNEEKVIYTNSAGTEYENSIEEILLHLIIHGQHHRAQLATLIRKAGVIPPSTDYIFFLRDHDHPDS